MSGLLAGPGGVASLLAAFLVASYRMLRFLFIFFMAWFW